MYLEQEMRSGSRAVSPTLISAEDWQRLAQMLNDLFVATGVGIAGAMSFLLAHAILPSLSGTGDIVGAFRRTRLIFYVLFCCALGLTCFALVRAFAQGVAFLDSFWPRYGY